MNFKLIDKRDNLEILQPDIYMKDHYIFCYCLAIISKKKITNAEISKQIIAILFGKHFNILGIFEFILFPYMHNNYKMSKDVIVNIFK